MIKRTCRSSASLLAAGLLGSSVVWSSVGAVGAVDASQETLSETPCVSPDVEKRCLGNLAQRCKQVPGQEGFRTVQDYNAISAGGNFVQMCQGSTGRCCAPAVGHNGNCQ
jgi:hypothetical protein